MCIYIYIYIIVLSTSRPRPVRTTGVPGAAQVDDFCRDSFNGDNFGREIG